MQLLRRRRLLPSNDGRLAKVTVRTDRPALKQNRRGVLEDLHNMGLLGKEVTVRTEIEAKNLVTVRVY